MLDKFSITGLNVSLVEEKCYTFPYGDYSEGAYTGLPSVSTDFSIVLTDSSGRKIASASCTYYSSDEAVEEFARYDREGIRELFLCDMLYRIPARKDLLNIIEDERFVKGYRFDYTRIPFIYIDEIAVNEDTEDGDVLKALMKSIVNAGVICREDISSSVLLIHSCEESIGKLSDIYGGSRICEGYLYIELLHEIDVEDLDSDIVSFPGVQQEERKQLEPSPFDFMPPKEKEPETEETDEPISVITSCGNVSFMNLPFLPEGYRLAFITEGTGTASEMTRAYIEEMETGTMVCLEGIECDGYRFSINKDDILEKLIKVL